jgi:hypothetical protein
LVLRVFDSFFSYVSQVRSLIECHGWDDHLHFEEYERILLDPAFLPITSLRESDFIQPIARDFGRWFIRRVSKSSLQVGDGEYLEVMSLFEEELESYMKFHRRLS